MLIYSKFGNRWRHLSIKLDDDNNKFSRNLSLCSAKVDVEETESFTDTLTQNKKKRCLLQMDPIDCQQSYLARNYPEVKKTLEARVPIV